MSNEWISIENLGLFIFKALNSVDHKYRWESRGSVIGRPTFGLLHSQWSGGESMQVPGIIGLECWLKLLGVFVVAVVGVVWWLVVCGWREPVEVKLQTKEEFHLERRIET